MEIWKDIEGYEWLYQVSNLGRVKSLDRYVRNRNGMTMKKGRIMKPFIRKDGYMHVNLIKDGMKLCYIHRLVAVSFIPNPLGLAEVNHKDENKANNTVDNLEWVSRLTNARYGTRNQRSSEKRRETSPCMKPVLQFTIDGAFVARHDSATKAARAVGVYQRCGYAGISLCCNGKQKKAYGYRWEWEQK